MKLLILGLRPDATLAEVERTVCADFRSRGTTGPIESQAYAVIAAEMKWSFSFDVSSFVDSGSCYTTGGTG